MPQAQVEPKWPNIVDGSRWPSPVKQPPMVLDASLPATLPRLHPGGYNNRPCLATTSSSQSVSSMSVSAKAQKNKEGNNQLHCGYGQ
ncbi:hypothetical protein V6N13_063803 [Hibiscus sabdariffa]